MISPFFLNQFGSNSKAFFLLNLNISFVFLLFIEHFEINESLLELRAKCRVRLAWRAKTKQNRGRGNDM